MLAAPPPWHKLLQTPLASASFMVRAPRLGSPWFTDLPGAGQNTRRLRSSLCAQPLKIAALRGRVYQETWFTLVHHLASIPGASTILTGHVDRHLPFDLGRSSEADRGCSLESDRPGRRVAERVGMRGRVNGSLLQSDAARRHGAQEPPPSFSTRPHPALGAPLSLRGWPYPALRAPLSLRGWPHPGLEARRSFSSWPDPAPRGSREL